MNEQQRLMHTLFHHEGREHVDVKFLRGTAQDLTPEDMCREANKALLLIDGDMAEGDETFAEAVKQVDVRELVAAI